MKVLIFLKRAEITIDMLQKLNKLIMETFMRDQTVVFEKIKVEDDPKLVKFYNIKSTPMTIIGSKRFPGIPNPQQVLDISRTTTHINVDDKFEPGKVVLVKGIMLSMLLSKVRDMKADEYSVLLITRTYPPALEKRYDLTSNELLWLMPKGVYVDGITVSDLEELEKNAMQFLDGTVKNYLVIDGLDILINFYQIDEIIGFLRRLKKKVSERMAICFVVYLPNAIEEKDRLAVIDVLKEE